MTPIFFGQGIFREQYDTTKGIITINNRVNVSFVTSKLDNLIGFDVIFFFFLLET